MKRYWPEFYKGSLKATKHGFIQRVKDYLAGRNFDAMEKTKELSAEEFETLQRDRLAERIRHAVEHVPHYRDNKDQYIRDGKPLPVDELPVLPKTLVKSQMDQFYAQGGVGLVRTHYTSGTSGTPLAIRMSWKTHSMLSAALNRARGTFGYHPGDRMVMLSGFFTPATMDYRQIWWRDYVGARVFMSIYRFSDERAAEYNEVIHRFRPKSLFGYSTKILQSSREDRYA